MRSSPVLHARLSRALCHRAWIAERFHQRLRGLLFRPPLEAGEGLLLLGVNSIHTFGMRYRLDVLFLSANLTITALHEGFSPNNVAFGRRDVRHTLELPFGAISAGCLRVHDQLVIG